MAFITGGGKAAALTALTGDVTASGPGSASTTIAKIQGKTVSGTTGTGNVVFSDSPVFTTAIFLPDGSAAHPAICFTSEGTVDGIFYDRAVGLDPSLAICMGSNGEILDINSTGTHYWPQSANFTSAPFLVFGPKGHETTAPKVPHIIQGGSSTTLIIEAPDTTGMLIFSVSGAGQFTLTSTLIEVEGSDIRMGDGAASDSIWWLAGSNGFIGKSKTGTIGRPAQAFIRDFVNLVPAVAATVTAATPAGSVSLYIDSVDGKLYRTTNTTATLIG